VKHIDGPNVVVVGGGGGASVLAADDLDAAGLKVPALLPETQQALAKVTQEAGTSIRNPIDTMSMWDDATFEGTLMPCATAPNADVVLFHTSFGGGPGARYQDIRPRMARQVESIRKVADESGTPIVVALRPATEAAAFEHSSE